jgi:dihydrodipicolinate reductase
VYKKGDMVPEKEVFLKKVDELMETYRKVYDSRGGFLNGALDALNMVKEYVKGLE